MAIVRDTGFESGVFGNEGFFDNSATPPVLDQVSPYSGAFVACCVAEVLPPTAIPPKKVEPVQFVPVHYPNRW